MYKNISINELRADIKLIIYIIQFFRGTPSTNSSSLKLTYWVSRSLPDPDSRGSAPFAISIFYLNYSSFNSRVGLDLVDFVTLRHLIKIMINKARSATAANENTIESTTVLSNCELGVELRIGIE